MFKLFSPNKNKKSKLIKNRSASTSDIYKLKKNLTYDDLRNTEENQIINKEITPCSSGKCNNNHTTEKLIVNTNLSDCENNELIQKNQIYEHKIYKNSLTKIEGKINAMVGSSAVNKPASGDKTIQTEMDRYGYVLVASKRKGSPQAKPENKKQNIVLQNKFEVLGKKDDKKTKSSNVESAEEKPPPIYLREKTSKKLIELLEKTVDKRFFLVPMRKGAIDETKIQLQTVEDYRQMVDISDELKKPFYTYQL